MAIGAESISHNLRCSFYILLTFTLDQCPHDLPPARWWQAPAPALGESVDQHEPAAAFFSETRLGWRGRHGVLVPDFNERCTPIGGEPEMDAGQSRFSGVARSAVVIG